MRIFHNTYKGYTWLSLTKNRKENLKTEEYRLVHECLIYSNIYAHICIDILYR